MSNSFGRRFVITTFGESHGPLIGVVIDGCPAGISLTEKDIDSALEKRRPGGTGLSTTRCEPDHCEIVSGLFEGKTTGSPLTILIKNKDARPADYDELKDIYRPGHADYTYAIKYGIRDHRGGGRSSGRETVCRVAAGAVAKKLFSSYETKVLAHLTSLGEVEAKYYDEEEISRNPFFCADREAAKEMAELAKKLKDEKDSTGGIIALVVTAPPQGLGEPIYDKLDARLAAAMMGIGAVKAVEIGDGFRLAQMRGSTANDMMSPEAFLSNHAGGILGGISTGEPITMRLAVKPIPSIGRLQKTIATDGSKREISISGRHDISAAARIVPVAEAMAWLTLADFLLLSRSTKL